MAGPEFSAGLQANGGISPQDSETETPYAVMATGTVGLESDLGDNTSLQLGLSAWVGTDNQQASGPSTVLRGTVGRLPYFLSRNALAYYSDDLQFFGINDLGARLHFHNKDQTVGAGLRLSAFRAIEADTYHYNHIYSVPRYPSEPGADPYPSHFIHENPALDTASPADPINPRIGPTAVLSTNIFFAEVLGQVGTAGDDPFDLGRRFYNATLVLRHGDLGAGDFKPLGRPSALTLAAYYTRMGDGETNDQGGLVSATDGGGLSLMLGVKNFLQAGLGYSRNCTDITEPGLDIETCYDGVNASVTKTVDDVDLSLAYSVLRLRESQEGFVDETEDTAEHGVHFGLVYRVADEGWGSVGLGFNWLVIVADNTQQISPETGSRSVALGTLNAAF